MQHQGAAHFPSHKLKGPEALALVPEFTGASTGVGILRAQDPYGDGSSSALSEGELVGLVLDSVSSKL